MARDAERTAFTRAWSYLNYNAPAKWAALLAAVGTGVLYVALLGLLWFFADLVVYRGQVPGYRDLAPADRVRFRDFWLGLTAEQQARYLADIGLPGKAGEPLLRDAAAGFDVLPAERQGVLWRAYVYQVLRDRVGSLAAAQVLPAFREVPATEQEAFAGYWAAVPDREAVMSGFIPNNTTLVNEVARADPRTLAADRQELVWRTALFQLADRSPAEGGDPRVRDFLQARQRAEAAGERPVPEPGAEPGTLDDRGLLSVVVRSEVQHNLLPPGSGVLAVWSPYRLATPALGTLAVWNPWTWQYGTAARPNYFYFLTGLLLLAVLVALLRAVLTFVRDYMAARATITAATRLRRAVYHHTFRLGTLAVRALGPSEAVSVFARHVEAVHDALYTRLTALFPQPILFVLLLVFALFIHPLLAVAFLLFALLIWLVGSQAAGYFRRQGRAASGRAAEQLTLIRESLMLMRLVKVYLMELFNQSRVERQLARYGTAQLRRYRGEAIYRPLLIFLGLLAALVLLYAAGLIVLHGQLGAASAITLAAALVSLYWPLHGWLEGRRFVRRGMDSAVAVFKFLDRPGEVGQVVGAEFLPPLGKAMEFDNVTLRDPSTGRTLLQDVSLTIKAGQRVAIVGPEDLEKHALVYLIPRFLDPTSGEIRVDEHNLRWVTLDSLRAQIALVMQHNLVYHDTVANNIGCGDPAYTLPQIIEAAKMAHAHQFIQKLPKGYETVVGELGHALSASEQFRVALARAILRDPALLIVEEPEVPLDDDDKSLLDDTFARVLPGRTAIFLPHRLSTIKGCDQIFLLHKGRLEAAGDHRGLLTQNPLYRHLHYLEFNEMVEQV